MRGKSPRRGRRSLPSSPSTATSSKGPRALPTSAISPRTTSSSTPRPSCRPLPVAARPTSTPARSTGSWRTIDPSTTPRPRSSPTRARSSSCGSTSREGPDRDRSRCRACVRRGLGCVECRRRTQPRCDAEGKGRPARSLHPNPLEPDGALDPRASSRTYVLRQLPRPRVRGRGLLDSTARHAGSTGSLQTTHRSVSGAISATPAATSARRRSLYRF